MNFDELYFLQIPTYQGQIFIELLVSMNARPKQSIDAISNKYMFKVIVKRAEPCQSDILLDSRIL